jgi:hypothetical protein
MRLKIDTENVQNRKIWKKNMVEKAKKYEKKLHCLIKKKKKRTNSLYVLWKMIV